MQITYKILITACCLFVLASCSPLRTGDLDRDHRTEGAASSVYPSADGDGDELGPLQ